MLRNYLQRFTRPLSLFLFSLGLTGLLAAFALALATPNGLGLANDSAAYIGGARGLLDGRGYSDVWLASNLEPITHYPPLYSLALAGLGILGLDPLRGARLVNVIAFGLSAILLGLLGRKMTRSYLAGLMLALLFAASGALMRVYAYALSEALFLTLSLLAFLLFAMHFEHDRNGWLLAAGAATGLAYLTRYTGLALAAAFCAVIILVKSTWRERLRGCALFLAAFLPWAAAWAIRNSIVAGNATNRTIGWHPVTISNIRRGVYAFSHFLMPVTEWQTILFKQRLIHWFLLLTGLTMLTWLLSVGLRRFLKPQAQPQPEVFSFGMGLYAYAYLSAVLLSMTLFDASTKFQPRILSPLYISFLVLLTALAHWLWRQDAKWLRWIVVAGAIFALVLSSIGFSRAFTDLRKGGQGYASWKWRDAEIMATLRALPADVAIYTNSPPAVYLVTGRASYVLPTPVDAVTLAKRPEYETQVARMRQEVLDGRAVLAVFDISEVEPAEGVSEEESLTSGLPVLKKQGASILFGVLAEE